MNSHTNHSKEAVPEMPMKIETLETTEQLVNWMTAVMRIFPENCEIYSSLWNEAYEKSNMENGNIQTVWHQCIEPAKCNS
jgi:hypothetical protein